MQEINNNDYLNNSLLELMSSYTIFTSREDLLKIKLGKSINIKGERIPVEFLKRILLDEKYYNYVLNYFNGENDKFIVANIINNDLGIKIEYKKNQIYAGLKEIIKDYQDDEEIIAKFTNLRDSLSFKQYVINNFNKFYEIDVENNYYKVPISSLIEMINLDENTFIDICKNSKIKTINEIPKDYFLYILKSLIEDKKIVENYLLPANIFKNYTALLEEQVIDLAAINKHLRTLDNKYKYVKLDKDLEKEIIANMPENLNDLEKAMYIYIKMCKTLSYDEEYYAVNQKGDAIEKHQDISYISNINLDNPKAVCYEFNAIYTKFLNDLGIKFQSKYKNMIGEAYGDGHVELDFRVGKYLVHADSVTTILGGDMVRSKLNQPIIGLKCINRNLDTNKEFKDSLDKVYNVIIEEEKDKSDRKPVESLESLLQEYENLTDNIRSISINDKFNLLIEKLNYSQLKGIDSYYYILKMKKMFFTEDELLEKVSFNLIRNNLPIDEDKTASIIGVFTLNTHNLYDYDMLNEYYYLDENNQLFKTSKEQIQEKFDSGEYDYIKSDDHNVPGIKDYRRKNGRRT
jgi:hypothetical protein